MLTIRLSCSYKKNSWAPVGHYCMDNHDNIFGWNVNFFDRKKKLLKNDILPVSYIEDNQTLKNKIESYICKISELVFFRWYHGFNERVIGL